MSPQLPCGFYYDDQITIAHRYSSMCVMPDLERNGGWCVVRDLHCHPETFEVVYIIVTFHDRLVDACAFIETLTNTNIKWSD